MSIFVEQFSENRPVSYNGLRYSLERRRAEGEKYARRFAYDWHIARVSLKSMSHLISTDVWSPVVFERGHRVKTDFKESWWCGLDFETPDYTLEQALVEWADTVCLIGVTANHQIPKHVKDLGLVTLDRFRIITPWERCISDRDEYEHNMRLLTDKYGADASCVDGARLFYPCARVVAVNSDGYLQPVLEKPQLLTVSSDPELARSLLAFYGGGVPRWVHKFLTAGELPSFSKFSASRAWTIWGVAESLAALDIPYEEIRRRILSAPFDRADFSDDEIEKKIADGVRTNKERRKKRGGHG